MSTQLLAVIIGGIIGIIGSLATTMYITITADSLLHINGLKVTEKHPFAVGVDKWKEAGKLKEGEQVLGNNNITIKNIKRVTKSVPVFNLTVNGTHNFYVNDVLIYNGWE